MPNAVFQLNWPEQTTFEIAIAIPKKAIDEEYQSVLKALAANFETAGFRKGKVPLSTVEEKIGREEVYREVIRKIIPKIYQEALEKYQLAPIIEPKVIIESAQENKDWKIKIVSCIKPEVRLGKYKEEIRKINTTGKIWTPQKGTKEPTREEKAQEEERKIQRILQKLTETIKMQIPQLIIDIELQKRLASLIDQLQKAGLILDEYLNAKKQTIEQLKEELRTQITNEWKLELILERITDEEKIQVEEKELKIILESRNKDKTRPPISPYLLAHFVRRKKTLDYLSDL